MEHLAERDGTGCRPRVQADYEAMRDFAETLDADVVAFQEVESIAAVQRVFPAARYDIVIEARTGVRSGPCRGKDGLFIGPQRTGFAIRKGQSFRRHPDFTALQVGDGDLRSGVDITLSPRGGKPIRLLSVHLKSGCSTGSSNEACPVFFSQVPILEGWIDARADERVRFAVVGDFNRRFVKAGDVAWLDLDDGSPANADLALASGSRSATCDPRYSDFIDYVVLDKRATGDLRGFDGIRYPGERLSDHCPIVAVLGK
jgi:endonuclease/exonuclease/phosphatase family metal-dependent hydrolase